jgi:pyrroline-5-carboxylate reductase
MIQSLTVFGAGAMGGAIVRGLVSAGEVAPETVLVADPYQPALDALAADCGVNTTTVPRDAAAGDPELFILAVKPQVLPSLLVDIKDELAGKLVVSIAAGTPLEYLEAELSDSRVVRTMPNLPLAVGKGATAICKGVSATADDVAKVVELFDTLGCAVEMNESILDVEGAVVGCGPAYFALAVDAFTRAAVRRGMNARDARRMIATTMVGVGEALLQSGENPRVYMERVTSPAGTTAAGLYALEPLMVEGAYEAVDAALERTYEMATDKK